MKIFMRGYKMKKKIIALSILALLSINAQDKRHLDKDKDSPLRKTTGITDRAAGTHNASNIGLFFENRGKLYPRRISQGPSGEYPINSGKHYIYRVNPYVAMPKNVIQGRFTTDEEWEAASGDHNTEYPQIAFSDNPRTWPKSGWPVKDANGKPIFKSDQDSYCAYNDSNNTKGILGLQIAQTGYAYGVKFASNLIFYKFELKNNGKKRLDSLYFALYCDVDVGNVSGGTPEYADDMVGIDKNRNFMYFYDSKGYSKEWPDGKSGYFGFQFLKTPKVNGKELGITDMHYFLYDDDDASDIDSIEFQRIASSPALFKSALGQKFFHVGNNSNIHFDDPATQPAGGLDVGAMISSGPYSLEVGQTLTFYTAMVAGDNLSEANKYADAAKKIVDYDFEISKPPTLPTLSGFAGDSKVTLYWDDAAEKSKDSFSGEYDFEGYRLYRSQDKGVNWELLADFDAINKIGINTGLQYSYTDSKVTNGFEYWYSITAYDRGDSTVSSLESSKGTSTDSKNLQAVTPKSLAAGYVPVSGTNVIHSGNHSSNYMFAVTPVDDNTLKGNNYKLGFGYTSYKNIGKLETNVQVVIRDSSKTSLSNYAVEWLAVDKIRLIDLATGDEVAPTPKLYRSGAQYNFNAALGVKLTDNTTDPSKLPKVGDYISINFSNYVVKNNMDTVVFPRALEIGKPISTSDGVIYKISKPDIISNVSRVGGTDKFNATFIVADETAIENNLYLVSTNGKGTNKSGEGFVSLLIKNQKQETVAKYDTVYNLGQFTFKGITGKVEFNSSAPPSPGNIYSVTVQIPVAPNLQDRYSFGINGSFINKELMAANISNIKVVPNPYLVSSLYEPEYGELRKEPLRQIQFINLPNECTIHIFSVAADLVKTIYHNSTNGTESWDLKAEGGREIAPGIYIYVVKADGAEYKSKFAIIK
jgi:hypothetical protein